MHELIEKYKKHIAENGLSDELFKWEILEKYKGRPDINAIDFQNEIKNVEFKNLPYRLTVGVSNHIAREKPEEYRHCFETLFDESLELIERINAFEAQVSAIYQDIVQNTNLNHCHDERTIAIFLTFHNPEKYTFYKSTFYRAYCYFLKIKPKRKNEKYVHYLELIDKLIDDYIKPDKELQEIFHSKLNENGYADPNYKILAQDILYQLFDKKIGVDKPIQNNTQYWLYSPGENAELWSEFYDSGIMALGWDFLGDLNQYEDKEEIRKRLQQHTNTTESKKNDTVANLDFKDTMQVGDVIFVKRGISELLGYGIVSSDYYFDDTRVTFQHCREVDWKKSGVWKSDHELVRKTLTNITTYPSEKPNFTHYYQNLFSLMETNDITSKATTTEVSTPLNLILYGPPGTGKTYNTINKSLEIIGENIVGKSRNEVKTLFDKRIQEGQIVFTTFHQSMSYEDFIEGIKPKTDTGNISYDIESGIFKKLCQAAKTPNQIGFDIAYESLKSELGEGELINLKTPRGKEFTVSLNSNNNLNLHTGNSREKQGTLTKENIQKHIKGEEKYKGWEGYFEGVIDFLKTKHGYSENQNNQVKNYVLIIDEINRGNVSQIFGELITLIEADKRAGRDEAIQLTLPYSKDEFSVPQNLYIIGTMNTADRSVEALDTALRRRFSFEEMPPIYDLPHLDYLVSDDITANALLKTINLRIEKLLDRDHLIGHAFFIKQAGEDAIDKVMNTFYKNIIPLLQEYFFGDYGKIGLILGKGFVSKESNEDTHFADFDYDAQAREIYGIVDYRKNSDSQDRFVDAIKILMNKNEK